ncbi:MAG: PQQ-binding-like beta-propeller repeat protein [Chloroflexi bacterium]|nr:PQQ-binding-like beta-propeller repeat protein [Chloroflexota bacterium]
MCLFPARRHWMGVALLLFVGLLTAACTGAPLSPSWAGLSVVGDGQNILIAFNERLVLINPTNGRPVELRNEDNQVRVDEQGNPRTWNIPAPDNNQTKFYAAPVSLDAETMLVLTYTRKAFVIDARNGRIDNPSGVDLAGHVISPPVIDGDRVYVGFTERNFAAYSLQSLAEGTGVVTPLWTFETDHGVWASALLVEGVLYVPCMNHNLYALDAETGTLLWTADLQGAITSTPVYLDGRLYIGTLNRRVYEVSVEDGIILSEFTTQDWVWGAPVIAAGVLYIGDMAGNVYALEISADGLVQRWSARPATMGIRATPVVADGYVIVAARDTWVYWLNSSDGSPVLDSDGNPLKRQVGGEVLADMLVIRPSETLDIPQPLLIVSTMNNAELLVAFGIENGQRQWVYGR